MSKKALVSIISENEVILDLPEPSSYSATTSPVIDSSTSVSGKLLGAVIRDDVAQVSMSWNHLDAETWSKINEHFKVSSNRPNSYVNRIRFYDQATGNWDDREMYVSDRSAGMWRRDEHGTVLGWTGCSMQLMEV